MSGMDDPRVHEFRRARRRKLDRYCIPVVAGHDPRYAQLTDAEFRAYFAGIVSIAARSPRPGFLLITPTVPADAAEIAVAAGVSRRVARRALQKAKDSHLLRYEDCYRAWYVVAWRTDHDPRPRRRSSMSPRLRTEVIERDGFVCGICGDAVAREDLEIDHILAVANGGTDDLDNLQVSHGSCNRKKSAQRSYSWRASGL